MNQEDLKTFERLQVFRGIAVFLAFASICQVFNLGIQPILFGGFAAFGVIRAGIILRNSASIKKILIEVAIWGLATYFFPSILSLIFKTLGLISKESLIGVVIADTTLVLGAALITTFISTLLFWKYRSHLTIETIVVIALTFSLVSGHRNYQLDAPKELSHLAWTLGIEPQNFFVALGVMLSLIFGGFLVAASSRPIIGGKIRSTNVGRVGKWSRFILPLSLFGLLIVYAQYVSSRYSENLGRASEGVGEGSEEGKSPLGFHSAVGKTKQPAALIRFEGDYPNNPWAPMLYIREGALSSFNGKEMVLAPRQFDSDVPRTSPGQPFLALEKDVTPAREEVTYSVFLLAQHKTAIAIDYPKSIRPIKNPDSNRFVATYQAVSIAPKVKLEQLSGEEFGDPSWSDEIRQHYLRAPGDQENSPSLPTSLSTPFLDNSREDLRYRALSKEIVDGLQTPFERAAGVINYLSKNSIYTRQPGHQSTNGGDPVAPYLFAEEKRGYCVHFAHAAVYLLRLAGIPARIGTGYLTDLSFAKDGHVLLNMGDRHAWPEVYVKGVGWAVFDIQPAKAENEIVQPPDEKLLEELMSKLDELGELTPPMPLDSPETGSSFGDQIIDTLSDKVLYLRLLAILIALFVLTKLYLRAGYTLTNDPRRKAIRAYQSVASNFCDLGEPRKYGETRLEYFERLKNLGKVKSLLVSQLYNEAHFSASKPTFSNNAVQAAVRDSISEDGVFRKIVRQILAFVSPFSILRWGKW